ncbi:hypothetical protein Slin15195_G021120 [Septoria linicola]|uniref:Uncharacterized protein n=1 Tax=Septoria linicola TaxID=215465 RepID=A0A9Q9AMF4_9PEZI|nr:hypothetical protein Slin14017_G021180 [Septoria linicola]USW48793.1 hypothetical protein Slin15195_G021120 [Septoria linicola]
MGGLVNGADVLGIGLSRAQKSGILFVFDQEREKGGCLIADDPGIWQDWHVCWPHAAVSLSEWRTAQGLEPDTDLPSVLIVPNNLIKKAVKDVANDLGASWHVVRYGNEKQLTLPGQPVQNFGLNNQGRSSIFRQIDATVPVRRQVLVMSDVQAGNFKDGRIDGRFKYKYIDECQEHRRCEINAKGKFVLSMKATLGAFPLSGTAIVNSLMSIHGYVALLTRTRLVQ